MTLLHALSCRRIWRVAKYIFPPISFPPSCFLLVTAQNLDYSCINLYIYIYIYIYIWRSYCPFYVKLGIMGSIWHLNHFNTFGIVIYFNTIYIYMHIVCLFSLSLYIYIEQTHTHTYTYTRLFGSFHIPEDCQHYLLYWPLRPERFLYWRVSVSTLSFQLRLILAKLFVNIFRLKHTFRYASHIPL